MTIIFFVKMNTKQWEVNYSKW